MLAYIPYMDPMGIVSRERKVAGNESLRKSSTKECQKTCAAKALRKHTPSHNKFSAKGPRKYIKTKYNRDVPAKAKTLVAKAPREPRESNSIG